MEKDIFLATACTKLTLILYKKNQTTLFKTMIYFYLEYKNVNKYGKNGVFSKNESEWLNKEKIIFFSYYTIKIQSSRGNHLTYKKYMYFS